MTNEQANTPVKDDFFKGRESSTAISAADVRHAMVALESRAIAAEAQVPKWQPMETAPVDTGILVWLEKPHIGANVVSAQFGENISFVGGYFAHDMPKPLFWMPLPAPPMKEGE